LGTAHLVDVLLLSHQRETDKDTDTEKQREMQVYSFNQLKNLCD